MKKRLFLEAGCDIKSEQEKYGRNLLFVSRLYTRFIEEINIIDLRKIAVRIIDPRVKESIMPVLKLIKVCSIHKHFDWSEYDNTPDEVSKYKIILDFISTNVLEVAEKFNWPKEPFEHAYLEVLKTQFRNDFTVLAAKQSKNKRYLASVITKGSAEMISLILCLEDKIDLIKIEIELFKLAYYIDDFSEISHKLKWLNNDEILISNKDEEINFKLNINSKSVEIFLTLKKHSEEYLKDDLKLLRAETTKDERIEITQRRINNRKL